jgi:uncharacterized protein YegP (UPF0339 family)
MHHKNSLINVVYSENHTEFIHTLCAQNGEFILLKNTGYSDWAEITRGTDFIRNGRSLFQEFARRNLGNL